MLWDMFNMVWYVFGAVVTVVFWLYVIARLNKTSFWQLLLNIADFFGVGPIPAQRKARAEAEACASRAAEMRRKQALADQERAATQAAAQARREVAHPYSDERMREYADSIVRALQSSPNAACPTQAPPSATETIDFYSLWQATDGFPERVLNELKEMVTARTKTPKTL